MLMRVTVLWESKEPEMGNRGMETKEASGGARCFFFVSGLKLLDASLI